MFGTILVFYKFANTVVGKAALWLFIIGLVVFPIGAIGLFGGGYNHLLKDIVYFSGASPSLMQGLFPPPKYEMPDDVFFEVSGVMQFHWPAMSRA
jgi:hypothetical protein